MDDDDDGCGKPHPVGDHHGGRFRAEGPVQVPEQVYRFVQDRSDKPLAVGHSGHRPDGDARLGRLGTHP